MKIDKRILKRLGQWQWRSVADGASKHDLFDYAGFIGTPLMYFAMAEVLWPEVLVRDERLYLASGWSEATYAEWIEKGVTGQGLQRVLNHRHLRTLLQGATQEADTKVAKEVGRIISLFWSKTLEDFAVQAEVVDGDYDELAVTMYQP